jgi:hypothetical protein
MAQESLVSLSKMFVDYVFLFQILFLGDSTNRGMMHYIIEQLNITLTEWDKTHDIKIYNNANRGRTRFIFAYYPQFWLANERRPNFAEALEQLISK